MLYLPPAPGTNPNITLALEDITEPALKREEGYSRITLTFQGLLDFETLYNQCLQSCRKL
jgi:predicted metal-binding membrane protein